MKFFLFLWDDLTFARVHVGRLFVSVRFKVDASFPFQLRPSVSLPHGSLSHVFSDGPAVFFSTAVWMA